MDRVASLTGVRAVAAILVVATHAAYTTGRYPQGYLGLIYSRMEIGVPIFFALSGFLLFRPWVQAAATGRSAPSTGRYFWHRVRRIMPAYVVTVLVAYLIYHFRTAGPNPGHTWYGLFRNLTSPRSTPTVICIPFCTRVLRRCGAWPSRPRSTWRCRCWRTC